MKERTQQILRALVQEFIRTAHPVASKRLLETGQFRVSSATVRNEFALLEDVGYIESPHTSAGKVPTSKGFRYYVDSFVGPTKEMPLPSNLQQTLQQGLSAYKLHKSKESVLDGLELLSHLTGNVAFAVVEDDRTMYLGLSSVLRKPEFLQNPELAAQIVEVLEGRERFHALLEKLETPEGVVKIFIGEENMLQEISSCAMLVVRFTASYSQGYLGVLGPMRMHYTLNKSLLEQVYTMLV
ncbi:hypothetical protein H6771_00970 [Candidatus Peribacteria bacterium]|nr:hypothetical protein [Candidatus Peribacteria bacterium]